MVPPTVLPAATHSVGLLIRTRSTGPDLPGSAGHDRLASGLRVCAQLRLTSWELAVNAGVRRGIAWLWPLVDRRLHRPATLALLSLTRRRATQQAASATNSSPTAAAPPPPAAIASQPVNVAPSYPVSTATAAAPTSRSAITPIAPTSTDWSDVAETLVRDGVTTKSITEVVEALQPGTGNPTQHHCGASACTATPSPKSPPPPKI